MIKIDILQDNKKAVIAMLSSIIELDECEEIWIKEKGNAIKTDGNKAIGLGNMGDILKGIGIPCHLLGYQYIQDAVRILIDDPCKFNKFATIVYSEIAANNGTKLSRVERAIRHAIDVAFTYGDINEIHKLFGNSYSKNKGKPTNKEFIAMLVELIKEGDSENEN